MRPLGGQQGEIGVQAAALALASRTPADVTLDDAHVCVGVLVRLAERDAGAHVEELSHGGPVITGAGDLRNVLRDRRLGVQAAPGGKDSADTSHDGLRHRHQQVSRVCPHLAEVAFEDDLAVVKHDDGVGPRVRQHLPDGGRTGTEPRDGDVVERPLVVRAHERLCPGAPGDALRGNNLAQMLEGPPVEGRVLPVLQAHHRLARWGEPCHQGIGHTGTLSGGCRSQSHPRRNCERRRCQAAEFAAVRETGLMWAKALRAFQVGKARTSPEGPWSWMRRSRVASAQVSWPACHLTKASDSAVM